MKAVTLTGPDIDRLRTVEQPDLELPGPGRVHVRMRAASLNYLDLAAASGQYPGVRFPIVPVMDGAGEVVAVGPDVWQASVGDRVVAHVRPRWIAGASTPAHLARTRGLTEDGSLVEVADVAADTVVHAPDHLDWEHVAALPVAYMAAWQALEDVGPGSTVCVLGTGGTSIAALQLAKARGARVLVTSSSDRKLDLARELGADAVVNYRQHPKWEREVRRLTAGIGADLVVETVGGQNLAHSIAATRHGGRIEAIGFLDASPTTFDILSVTANNLRISGMNGGSVADLAATFAAVEAQHLAPVIDRSYPVAAVQEAYHDLARGGHFGKLVISIDW